MFRNWISRLLSSSNGGRPASRRSPRPTRRPALLNLFSLEDRIVPATFYVDPTIVGNAGDAATFNLGRTGAVSGLTIGTDAFQDIGSAVTAAAGTTGPDTIRLAQATIVSNVNFTINTTVDFIGSGVGLTILNPNASTVDDSGDAAAWYKITGGATVTFSLLSFDGLGSTFGIGEAVRYDGAAGTVDGVTFTNISRSITGNKYEGVGVVAKNSTVTVNNTAFTNMGRSGAVFTADLTNGTFTGNSYTGKGIGDNLDNAIEVSFGASALITGNVITNCLGVAASDGSFSTALIVADPGTMVTALGNTFTNNQVGVIVGFNSSDTPTVVLNYNNIFGNNLGIATDVAQGSEVDARNNFFGTTDGPQADAQNPSGNGNFINDVDGLTILGPFLREATPVLKSPSVPQQIADGTPPEVYAVGAGAGGAPHVRVFRNGVEILSFFAYDTSFSGGVRVAVGDVDGDGSVDIITAAGAGGGPHVKVFDIFGNLTKSFFAYNSAFSGGVYLAVGDIDGDTIDDIITGAGAGGGPHVKVFDGRTLAEKLSFFAYDAGYNGGVTVATGDITNDYIDEIVTGAATGSPHVKVFDGRTAAEMRSFFAFDPGYTGGINVGAGDTNLDGFAEIFAGTASGGAIVSVFNSNGTFNNIYNADPTSTSGIRVSGVDLPGNGTKLLLYGAGNNAPANISFFDTLTNSTTLTDTAFVLPLPGGVFVG